MGGESSFQCLKGIIARLVPGPGVSFLGEVKERAGSVGVVGNKVTIEVCKAQEGAHILYC